MTSEFWRVSDCEGLVEEVNHTAKFVTDLFSFVVVTRNIYVIRYNTLIRNYKST